MKAIANRERDLMLRVTQRTQASHFKAAAVGLDLSRRAFEELFQVAADHHAHHALVSDLALLNLACVLSPAS